jgi:hypothetical protein
MTNLGLVLIFGVVLVPLYIMLTAWFAGRPHDIRLSMTGVGYLVSITVGMWVGLAAFAFVLGLVFF